MNGFPSHLRAGDAVNFVVRHVPAGSSVFFVLSCVIAGVPTRIRIGGDSGVAVDATGMASFAVPSATSSAWAAGQYKWVAFAVDGGGSRTEIGEGGITIDPDPAGENAVDTRTYDEKLLQAIRDLLAGKALDDVTMYKIGTRELTKLPLADLQKWEGIIEGRVRRANRRKAGKSIYRSAPVRFGGVC